MKIDITVREQKMLIALINNGVFKGNLLEEVLALKRKIEKGVDDDGTQLQAGKDN